MHVMVNRHWAAIPSVGAHHLLSDSFDEHPIREANIPL